MMWLITRLDVLQAAKVKSCEIITEWSEPICNHFWHVDENCDESVEKLKVKQKLAVQ